MGVRNSKPQVVISLCGNIGVGKTSILNWILKNRSELGVLREAVDEWAPFLTQFYADMRRYALALQLIILHTQSRDKRALTNKVIISERCPLDAMHVFWKELKDTQIVDDSDDALYTSAYEHSLWIPDVIIYLTSDPEIIYERIVKRGQAGDSGISKDYLVQLHEGYEAFIQRVPTLHPNIVVKRVDVNRPLEVVLSEVASIIDIYS